MALPISLKVNTPRPLLRREGFALSRTAKAFRGAIRRKLTNDPTYEYVPAGLGEDELLGIPIDDPGIFQFPETGVLQLKPSGLRPDLMENEAFAPFWLGIDDFLYRTYGDPLRSELFEIPQDHLPSAPKVLNVQREDTTDLVGITPTQTQAASLDLDTRFSLIWLAESTAAFHPNESFSVFINPFGIMSDRAAAFFGILYGYRWYLQLNMAGGFALYEYVPGKVGELPSWVRRKTFAFAQGGIDMSREFQLTVIPHFQDAIEFLFSQAAQGDPSQASDYKAAVSAGFMYECKKNGFTPPFSVAMQQAIKTDAAPIAIAVRKDRYQVAFMIHRNRYIESGFTLVPETIDEPKPARTPTVDPIGYFGQNLAGEAGAKVQKSKTDSTLGARFVNEKDEVWTPSKDTKIVASCWLKPSGASIAQAIYSPEIWAMEYRVLPETHTVADAEQDLSDQWTKISGRLSTHPDTDGIEFRFWRNAWRKIYKLDGPVDLEVDGYLLHEGEILQYRPTSEGRFSFYSDDPAIAGDNAGKVRTRPRFFDDADSTGFWDSLNETSASHMLTLTSRSYGAIIYELLRLRGDEDASIDIAAELYSLQVDGWEAANDWKQASENMSLGDVARLLIALYGAQGSVETNAAAPRDLRLVRRDGISKAFLSPVYDPATFPAHVFYLSLRAVPEAIRALEDTDRWDGVEGVRYWKTFSAAEFTRRRADYNAVKSYCTVGNAEGADMFAAFISPHPDALEDGANWDFQGRVRSRCYGPNENAMASTLLELQRVTRRRYDTEARPMLSLVLEAEFQPGKIDTDQFVCVVMPAIDDDVDEAYLEGDPVTFGAFRILEIQYEFELSPPDAEPGDVLVDLPAQDFPIRPELTPDEEGPIGGGLPVEDPTGETSITMSPLTGMIGSTARRASWQARYILEYVGEIVSEDYAMFSTMLPDFGRAPA